MSYYWNFLVSAAILFIMSSEAGRGIRGSAMEPCFTSLVSRRIWRPAPGEGIDLVDHAYKRSDGGVGADADALFDIQLLAKCGVVLMTRWTAFASHVLYILERPDAVFLYYKQTARS